MTLIFFRNHILRYKENKYNSDRKCKKIIILIIINKEVKYKIGERGKT